MKNEKIIWLKVETDRYYNLLLKLSEIGIVLLDNKKTQNNILIKTTYSDYKKIKKYLVSYKVTIFSNSGILKVKEILNKYRIFTIGIILGIIILFIVNNMIFKIEVKSTNKNIQNLIQTELKNNGIGIFRLKKTHSKIEKIVNKILEDNKDTLEWLEIKYDGLLMIVNVTEKTITNESSEYNNCNIIASTDAKISSLNIYRGVPLKEINDYVLKGDVILSGSIIHNEEVKNTVCASGEVYGEVWYKVKVEVPFKETYINYTGKNRYNLSVKINDDNYQIFRSRIKNKKEKITHLYKLDDFEINLVKEKEYTTETKILSEKEAYEKGISLAIEKVNLKLEDNEKILTKKVLKKDINDSTIYLEIFIVTKENIGVLQEVKEGGTDGVESNS